MDLVFIAGLLFVAFSAAFWIDDCGVLRLLFGVLVVDCWLLGFWLGCGYAVSVRFGIACVVWIVCRFCGGCI